MDETPKIGVLEQERQRKAAHAALGVPDPAALSAARRLEQHKIGAPDLPVLPLIPLARRARRP